MIQKINNHIVKCGDIQNGIDDLMGNDKADFTYSDPPWGQGNLRYWQTMNFKMTGKQRRDIIYDDFINNLFLILQKFSNDKVVIEYGQRWKEDIINLSSKYGFIHNAVYTGYYNAGKNMLPLDFHFLSKKQSYIIEGEIIEQIRTLSGLKVVKAIFDYWCPKDANIILDPMCGMGYTAQATVDNGFYFRGNELNSKRLQKTIARLQ